MTAALAPIITTLVVIAIIFIAIFILVMFIKHKINSATRKYLGMNFQQTADLIGRGLREETTPPKPISSFILEVILQYFTDILLIIYNKYLHNSSEFQGAKLYTFSEK